MFSKKTQNLTNTPNTGNAQNAIGTLNKIMEIKLTKEQYENLLKLVYLGNWIVNSIRSGEEDDKRIEKYENIAQYIYSFSREEGLERYIEFDKQVNRFFPTREFEEDTDLERYRQEYDDEVFWQELIHRLAERDFIKEYGENTIKKMNWRERLEKEQPFIEKYGEEFEESGLMNLEILKKLNEML